MLICFWFVLYWFTCCGGLISVCLCCCYGCLGFCVGLIGLFGYWFGDLFIWLVISRLRSGLLLLFVVVCLFDFVFTLGLGGLLLRCFLFGGLIICDCLVLFGVLYYDGWLKLFCDFGLTVAVFYLFAWVVVVVGYGCGCLLDWWLPGCDLFVC